MAERPLHVCHLGKYYPPASGGVETHVRTLAQAQAALGVEVHVVCVNHADPAGRDRTWNVFGSTRTLHETDGLVRVTRVGRQASVARLDLCPDLPGVLHRLGRHPMDIFHLHTPNPSMLLALALVRPRTPLVITHHSDIIRQRMLRYALAPLEHRVYARAARILATSPAYAAGSPLLQRYRENVQDLPLGLDLEPYLRPSPCALAYADRLRVAYGSPLWLTVGRLTYYKGLHIGLEALTRVPGRLLVVGTGPLEAHLRHRAVELGVGGRVAWCGYLSCDELVGAYHAATALWFPSNARSEGFGLVQVEAMASGCPVINTAIPASGVSWVSRHQETGLTCPVNDPPALAHAAQRLLAEPGLRQRLAAAAREQACQRFGNTLMARRSLGIYQRALAGESRPCPEEAFSHSGQQTVATV